MDMKPEEDKSKLAESRPAQGRENNVSSPRNAQNQPQPQQSSQPTRVSTTLLLQLAGLLVAGAVAFATANVKVESLQRAQDNESVASIEILKRVSELQAKVDFMTEELRYIRSRTDRMVERKDKEKDQ
jgi:hypothetical protein